jgi:hypothetical protein
VKPGGAELGPKKKEDKERRKEEGRKEGGKFR